MHTFSRRDFIAIAGGISAGAVLSACSNQGKTPDGSAETTSESAELAVHVATLKGPTSMGLAKLEKDVQDGKSEHSYEFKMYTNPADEVLPLLVKGDVDIACLPANVAAIAYNKTKGGVRVIDINTLGVLYMVSADDKILQLKDLAGRTLYVPNQGTTPDYVTQFLLASAGVADQVTIQYVSEPTEIIASLAKDSTAAGVLPEPFVTAALTKNESLHRVLDLRKEWGYAVDDDSELVTGVTVVRSEFLTQHRKLVEQFLSDHEDSVHEVNADPKTYGQVIVDLGIVDAAPIATKAIPHCNLVYLSGDQMRESLEGYLKVLFEANPKSVGGQLPQDDFYLVD
ncbi:ABC transporter substrate-binding protein [Olegusella massiliensis]|uniref:ABC transporter substrate-binding protein n=1 Tax=Olegusella massiliensis TaxID=1776381 RepID=UPI0040558BA3